MIRINFQRFEWLSRKSPKVFTGLHLVFTPVSLASETRTSGDVQNVAGPSNLIKPLWVQIGILFPILMDILSLAM